MTDEFFLPLFDISFLTFIPSAFRPFEHQACFGLAALHKHVLERWRWPSLVEGQQGVQYHSSFPAAKTSAWKMIFLKTNQVSSPFTWKRQVLEEHTITATQLVSDASGLGCGARVVGPVTASPVTRQGDVVGWVPPVRYDGEGVQCYESLQGSPLFFLLLGNICSHLGARLTTTHCVGSKSSE